MSTIIKSFHYMLFQIHIISMFIYKHFISTYVVERIHLCISQHNPLFCTAKGLVRIIEQLQ